MAKVDISKEIRRAVDSGSVLFGQKETEKSVLDGHAKMLVLAKNIPKSFKERLMHTAKIAGIHVLEFEESGLELGSVCGKPFNVSAMAVTDFGKSSLSAVESDQKRPAEGGRVASSRSRPK